MSHNFALTSTPKKRKHPTTQKMVDEALTSLNESKGCSYMVIKRFILSSYEVDMKRLIFYIKKYIKASVANGKLIQLSGRGVNGTFRLSAAAKRNPEKFLAKSAGVKKSRNHRKPRLRTIRRVNVQNKSRRTSLFRFSIPRRRLIKPPKPRLARVGTRLSLSSEDDDDSPTTSMEAISRAEAHDPPLSQIY